MVVDFVSLSAAVAEELHGVELDVSDDTGERDSSVGGRRLVFSAGRALVFLHGQHQPFGSHIM